MGGQTTLHRRKIRETKGRERLSTQIKGGRAHFNEREDSVIRKADQRNGKEGSRSKSKYAGEIRGGSKEREGSIDAEEINRKEVKGKRGAKGKTGGGGKGE